MNPAFSIARRELTIAPRRKRFRLRRCGVVATAFMAVCWGLLYSGATRTTAAGLYLFAPLAMFGVVTVSFVAVQTSCMLIAREKEDRTLGLLFLTDVSAWGVVVGKLLASLTASYLAVFSALPLMILAVTLGGVSTGQVLAAVALVLSTAFVGICAGLLGSCLAKSTKAANSLAGLMWILLFAVPPLSVVVDAALREQLPSEPLLAVISPFVGMAGIVGGKNVWHPLANCGLSIGLALCFLWLARLLLPFSVFSKEKPPLKQRLKESLAPARGRRSLFEIPAIKGNPVSWKDYNFDCGGFWPLTILCAAVNAVLATIVALVARKFGEADWGDVWHAITIVCFFCSAGAMFVGSLALFGRAFWTERRNRALGLLLTTDLTDVEIVKGKIAAVLRAMIPWAVVVLACLIIMMSWVGCERDGWQVLEVGTLEYLSMWFGLCSLALLISLRGRKNNAVGVCVGLVVVWNMFARGMIAMAMAKFRLSGWTMVWADVIAHVVLGVVCFRAVFESLRSIAARESC